MFLAVTVISCLILLDFALIGWVPSIFKIWPPLSELTEEVLIDDSTVWGSIKTNAEGKYVNSMINNRVGYKSLLLTSKCLVVKNTRRTYLLRIDLSSISSYAVVKRLVGKRIILNLFVENQEKFFQFRTKKLDVWKKAFSDLGLHQIEGATVN